MPNILPLTNGEFSGKKNARIVRAAVRLALLRKRRNHFECLFVRHPKKGLEFPGGAIEPNELPIYAALRELQEESGMIFNADILAIKHLGFQNVIDARGGCWLDIILYTLLDKGLKIRKRTRREFETRWLSLEEALILCRRNDVDFITLAIAKLENVKTS